MKPIDRARQGHGPPAGAPSEAGPAPRPFDPERLEALGRLSAGVVHDFSNLLFVIVGQLEAAELLLPRGHPAHDHLVPALQAAERASSLARGLLTFARRSATDRRVIDLNAIMARIDGMLRPVIGENILVDIVPGTDLRSVSADPLQIEQLLLNLALNARDAMPEGGRLHIETRNVEGPDEAWEGSNTDKPVLLLVSDDGVGMDAHTQRHIFEPFFTTKPGGTGSGLGLSTVHDIVGHSGGSIAVDSSPGCGTTFRIYLPCSASTNEAPASRPLVATLPGGTETILLLEESNALRETTRALLADLGYDILAVSRGNEALALARTHRGAIHLLLTDLVMPEAPASSVADEFGSLRPATRCLFFSRYSDDAGVPGLPPLASAAGHRRLALAVREALDKSRLIPTDYAPPPGMEARRSSESQAAAEREKED